MCLPRCAAGDFSQALSFEIPCLMVPSGCLITQCEAVTSKALFNLQSCVRMTAAQDIVQDTVALNCWLHRQHAGSRLLLGRRSGWLDTCPTAISRQTSAHGSQHTFKVESIDSIKQRHCLPYGTARLETKVSPTAFPVP